MTSGGAVLQTDLPGLVRRGKVRDVYEVGDALMIVATDRISAFDVVMDQPIPGKGLVLTQLTRFWLETLPACSPHHLRYVVDAERCPLEFEQQRETLRGRAMVCRKAAVLPVECVARGYLIGGGWREYQESGSVSGVPLPAGLRQAERLAKPIFTPSTKADSGHDEPIDFERAVRVASDFAVRLGLSRERGAELMHQARDRSLAIYTSAATFAQARGLLIADTKFEFGVAGDELLLVDEVLTPDSSRFWRASDWRPGSNPKSFDKQFLRDYLNGLAWDKTPPPPRIPDEILAQTGERYEEAYRLLTGREPGR